MVIGILSGTNLNHCSSQVGTCIINLSSCCHKSWTINCFFSFFRFFSIYFYLFMPLILLVTLLFQVFLLSGAVSYTNIGKEGRSPHIFVAAISNMKKYIISRLTAQRFAIWLCFLRGKGVFWIFSILSRHRENSSIFRDFCFIIIFRRLLV